MGVAVFGQAPKVALAPANGVGKNAVGMEFVKIAPGEFVMGCSEGDTTCTADEKPAHRVQITKPFEIGKYEVTQAQWQAVMGLNPSTIKGDDHPVETVSKNDAHDFLAKLNAANDGYTYRLPTEAEWEFAARAGSAGEPASLDDIAWYGANSAMKLIRWARRNPTRGACTTCWATCGSGWKTTSRATTTATVRWRIPRDPRRSQAARAAEEAAAEGSGAAEAAGAAPAAEAAGCGNCPSCAAERGITTRSFCASPRATTTMVQL